jgi:hypothetical protein
MFLDQIQVQQFIVLCCTRTTQEVIFHTFTKILMATILWKNINASNNARSWLCLVYFSLSAPAFQLDTDIYVGMFNNYSMTPEFKMDYNPKKKVMKKQF